MGYELPYEIPFIIILNILHTVLLKKVMDSFLVLENQRQRMVKPFFALYYCATAAAYGVFHVSAAYGLCNAAGIFGLGCLYRAAWKKRLWLSFSFLCMDMGCLLTVYFACSGRIIGPEDAVWILLLLICVMFISRTADAAEEKESSFDTRQPLLLILIPALGNFAFGAIFYGVISMRLAAFLCLLIVAVNLCVFYLVHELERNYVRLREQDIYRQQTFAYRNQLEVIMESQSRIRALKHDMKNHLLAVQALAGASQPEKILEYLASMQEFMTNPSEHIFTGNEELDSLLNYKLKRARESLKAVETDIVLPEKLRLYSFDLNVVLGNLLDNAIAASERTQEQLLRLSMRLEKGVLFLRMVNSCEGIPDGVCNIRNMAEKSVEGHGIGLANVGRIVEKYHGEIDMSCDGHRMKTEVMLYMKTL